MKTRNYIVYKISLPLNNYLNENNLLVEISEEKEIKTHSNGMNEPNVDVDYLR